MPIFCFPKLKLDGVSVADLMKEAGLTVGGFYKHFRSKEDLFAEALSDAFREIADSLARGAEHTQRGAAWKTIVRTYLSPEHCDHAELGCPVVALAPELARAGRKTKAQVAEELTSYKNRLAPLMPGRRRADKERNFITIFSTMIGAVAIARMLPDSASRASVLTTARDFLLHKF